MPAKISTARRNSFFRTLSETGNQALAAERARLSKTWIWDNRRRDPAFAAQLLTVTATARARLKAVAAQQPDTAPGVPRNWREIGGELLVVRGTNRVRAQIARARVRQWTQLEEKLFLARLATVGNVRLACAAAGLSVSSAYKRRRTWPAFAQAWKEALELGCIRLEMALIANASNMMTGSPDYEPEADFPDMTTDHAMMLLTLRQKEVRANIRSRAAARTQLPDIEDVRAEVFRRIAIVKRYGEIDEQGLEN